jgi:hypothetical protein
MNTHRTSVTAWLLAVLALAPYRHRWTVRLHSSPSSHPLRPTWRCPSRDTSGELDRPHGTLSARRPAFVGALEAETLPAPLDSLCAAIAESAPHESQIQSRTTMYVGFRINNDDSISWTAWHTNRIDCELEVLQMLSVLDARRETLQFLLSKSIFLAYRKGNTPTPRS